MPLNSAAVLLGSASEYGSEPGQTSEKLNCVNTRTFSFTAKSKLRRARLEIWSPVAYGVPVGAHALRERKRMSPVILSLSETSERSSPMLPASGTGGAKLKHWGVPLW